MTFISLRLHLVDLLHTGLKSFLEGKECKYVMVWVLGFSNNLSYMLPRSRDEHGLDGGIAFSY